MFVDLHRLRTKIKSDVVTSITFTKTWGAQSQRLMEEKGCRGHWCSEKMKLLKCFLFICPRFYICFQHTSRGYLSLATTTALTWSSTEDASETLFAADTFRENTTVLFCWCYAFLNSWYWPRSETTDTPLGRNLVCLNYHPASLRNGKGKSGRKIIC